jgi:hypothetical protein
MPFDAAMTAASPAACNGTPPLAARAFCNAAVKAAAAITTSNRTAGQTRHKMSSVGLYSVDSVDKHRDRNTDPKMRPRRQETRPKTKGKPPTTQKQTKTQGHCPDLTGFCIKSLTVDTKVRTVRSLSTPGLTYKYSHIVHKTCLCSAASVGGVGLSGLVPEILFFCSTEKVTAP